MSDNYRLLLSETALFYERHEAGRRDPFNVFSVLRSGHDEVNLHSRFLHALLDYRQQPDEYRKNLEDFLRSIVGIDKLYPDDAIVERESDNIDILIRDRSSMQAVVIENKIWAGDQHEQLWRYAKRLKEQGYTPHLLYLTLDGHDPSEDSVKGLDPKCVKCISYKEDLSPWLKRCQKRAYDEPVLRESVAQYLHLIEKLTGKDYSEAYMKELKELCLQGNNLVLVHDLKEAMNEVRVSLLRELWQAIRCEMNTIADLRDRFQEDTFEKKIEDFVNGRRNTMTRGLSYKVGDNACLRVVVENSIIFGVRCHKEESKDEYTKFKEALEGALKGGSSNPWWPWYDDPTDLNLRNPTRKDLGLIKKLMEEKKRQQYVKELVSGVDKLWKSIKDAGLV